MKFGEGLFGKKPEKKFEKILPEAVRYELAHNQAKLSKESIEILNNNNFTKEASYLLAKLLEINEHDRFEYLRALVEKYSRVETNEIHIREINNKFLKFITNDREVEGMKLAQLSRQGFDHWQEQYQKIAKDLAEKNEDVFLLANSTIIGLEPIVKEFYKKQKSFGIIFPDNIVGGNTVIGYEYIFTDEVYVSGLIDRNKEHSKQSVVLDDVENTAETKKMIEGAWAEKFGGTVEYVTVAKT